MARLVGNEGSVSSPTKTNVKVEGPTLIPVTKVGPARKLEGLFEKCKGISERGSFLRIVFQELGEGMFQKSWRNCLKDHFENRWVGLGCSTLLLLFKAHKLVYPKTSWRLDDLGCVISSFSTACQAPGLYRNIQNMQICRKMHKWACTCWCCSSAGNQDNTLWINQLKK